MKYTFEEIMNFHPDNKRVYHEIKNNISNLVPFVGAGLTAFAYGTWNDLLYSLTDRLTDTAEKKRIKDMISQGGNNCFAAAELLEKKRSALNFKHDLMYYFSEKKLSEKETQLPEEAVWLLPELFQELVITTNFDSVLEYVYKKRGHEFKEVFGPGKNELLLTALREKNEGALFKLHGTIKDGFVDYSKIVLTESQYRRHYSDDSVLTGSLQECFRDKLLLFLGCSLKQDLTMELLRKILRPGIKNYTIINCSKNERDERVRQLGDLNIRAIVYEGNRHEAVRIILEHLSEDLHCEQRGEFGKSLVIKGNQSLHIDSILDTDISKAVFRTEEIESIRRRIEINQSSVLFLAGRPGIGKTTLARLYANTCKGKIIYFVKYRGSFEETLNSLSIKKREDSWKKVLEYWKKLDGKKRNQILLIIDNFNDDSVDGAEKAYYEALGTGVYEELKDLGIQLLITTRINVGKNVYVVEGVKDPITLFEAYYKRDLNEQQKKDVRSLAELLHNNTLLLALCAGLMREECSLDELISEIKKCNSKTHDLFLEKEADFDDEGRRERFTLYEQVKAILNIGTVLKQEANCYILANMALLPLRGMQKKEFLQFIHKETGEGVNLINSLILRSWILEENHVVCLHPLIREVVLDNDFVVSWDRCREYCNSLNERLDLKHEFRDREPYKNYAEEVYTIFHDTHDRVLAELFYNLSDIYDQTANRKKSREMIDHVVPYLDEIEESRRKVRLYGGIAYSYNNQAHTVKDLDYAAGLLNQAEDMLERIRARCTTWEYYCESGRIYSNRGSNELARISWEEDKEQSNKHALRALEFHQRALEQRKKALESTCVKDEIASSKRDIATSYIGVAAAYFKLGCFEDAVQVFSQSLTIRAVYDVGRVPISQQGILKSILGWYNKKGSCDFAIFEKVLNFYPDLLNKNMEQENESAFHRNKLYFEELCKIINQDDDFAALRTAAEEKGRAVRLMNVDFCGLPS